MTPEQEKNIKDIRFALLNQAPRCFLQFSDMIVFQKSLSVLPLDAIHVLKQYYDFIISNGVVDSNLNEIDRAKMVDDEIARRQSIRMSSMFNINLN